MGHCGGAGMSEDAKTEREIVGCDERCGAYEEPETLDEYKLTLEHYKHHTYLSGCSHGC